MEQGGGMQQTRAASTTAGSFWGPVLILGSAVLWGTSGTAQALGPEGAVPLDIAIIRVGLGGLVLLGAAAIRGQLASPRRYARPVFVLAGLSQAVFNVSYFTGIAMTGVAVGTMIAIGSVPIFSGLLGILANRDPAGPRWYAATAIAVVGIVLLSNAETAAGVEPLGVFFSLLGGFSYSFFTFLSGRMVRTHAPDVLIAVSFLVATVLLLPFAAGTAVSWAATPRGVGLVLYMGLVSSALAYMLYGRGLRSVLISRVGILTLAEPLTGSMLGIFLLAEPMTARTLTGIVLVFAAQVLIVLRGRRGRAGARAGPRA
jgi:DME family drug/metabolite transporter